ncbi:YybH family protein [Streptomyces misionensis]|uniref:YybH family protein n=1 Tax=Streptomyces misionensis TaxID=67331 RepID=UPI0037003B44
MSNIKEEDVVRLQRERWRDAFVARDVETIMSFYLDSDSYVAFDIMPPMSFNGTAEWRSNWENFFSMFDSDPTYEFKDVRVTCVEDLAVVTSFTRFAGIVLGREIDMWARETNVLRKVDGTWLLTHDHISVPADLNTGRACMDLVP